jgi:predicted membrane protein
VYALSLPIRRSRYLLLRYGAGLTLLLGIGAALLAGATIAVLRVQVPPLLHAYPVGLTLRFCMAGLVAYTLLFSVSGLTPRAARLLAALLLFLVVASLVADLLGLGWNPVERAMDALLSPYSPLSIFRARWMLVDV